jgi:hypothetical protein
MAAASEPTSALALAAMLLHENRVVAVIEEYRAATNARAAAEKGYWRVVHEMEDLLHRTFDDHDIPDGMTSAQARRWAEVSSDLRAESRRFTDVKLEQEERLRRARVELQALESSFAAATW